MIKKCVVCGEKFDGYSIKETCSKACGKIYIHDLMENYRRGEKIPIYMKDYCRKPENKNQKHSQTPAYILLKIAQIKTYRKERKRARAEKAFRQTPEFKAQQRAYRRAYRRAYHENKKLEKEVSIALQIMTFNL